MATDPVHPVETITVRVDDLAVAYRSGRGRVRVFEGVRLVAAPGQITAITGPSGSGKTSLLHVIAGIVEPVEGTVEFIADGAAPTARPRIGFVYQDHRLVPFLTAEENVHLAAEVAGRTLPEPELVSLLQHLGVDGLQRSLPDELSGGEQQRVAIARAVASGAPVLLVDEPTASVDREAARSIGALFRDLARSWPVTVLVATHDPLIIATADVVVPITARSRRSPR